MDEKEKLTSGVLAELSVLRGRMDTMRQTILDQLILGDSGDEVVAHSMHVLGAKDAFQIQFDDEQKQYQILKRNSGI